MSVSIIGGKLAPSMKYKPERSFEMVRNAGGRFEIRIGSLPLELGEAVLVGGGGWGVGLWVDVKGFVM